MNPGGKARGNARGFALMLVFAVAVSIVLGFVVERFTAPGWERTFWFGVGLTAILFPAGRFAERRGWIHGFWYAGPAAHAGADKPGTDADRTPAAPTPPRSDAEGAAAPAAQPLHARDDATTPSTTRASSGESR